jgi:DUF917 family protein
MANVTTKIQGFATMTPKTLRIVQFDEFGNALQEQALSIWLPDLKALMDGKAYHIKVVKIKKNGETA